MFFIFSHLSVSHYINIDIGAQFIRAAKIWPTGTASMAVNRQGQTMTPNSISFKLPDMTDEHLSKQNISNLQVRIGNPSLQNLKYKPKSGFPYVGSIIGRDHSEYFDMPTIATSSEMLSLILQDLLDSKDFLGNEGVTFTIPGHYTYRQREAIMQSFSATDLNFIGLIDDFQANIYGYAHKFLDRIALNQSVLFIDVGASHVSAYRVQYFMNMSGLRANLTSYETSEETGSFAFAKAISKSKNIPFRKAMKQVQNGRIDKADIENELEELSRIVLIALNNEHVDSVQLFGGTSKLKIVEETINSSLEKYTIKRELSTVDANALGGALITQVIAGGMDWPIVIDQKPRFSLYVKCGDVSQKYCEKGDKCVQYIKLDNAYCERITIEADKDHVSKGVDPLINEYYLKNISSFKNVAEKIGGFLEMHTLIPEIKTVDWCLSDTLDCKKIEFETIAFDKKKFENSTNFVKDIIKRESKQRRILNLKGQVREKVEELLSLAKGDAVEAAQKIAEKANKVADECEDVAELEDTIKQLRDNIYDYNNIFGNNIEL